MAKTLKFSMTIPPMTCSMCGQPFDKKWSSGGVGKVCKDCVNERDHIDLIEAGLIRNIQQVNDEHCSNGYSYTFETKIDDKWFKCRQPCGNWSCVNEYGKDSNVPFSVPVGWWELDDLYKKHAPELPVVQPHFHEPDWSTVHLADGTDNILDVQCKCGKSGSMTVVPSDINWES